MNPSNYNKSNSIQSIARALDIIDLIFAQAKPVSLTYISKQLDIPPVTTFRILSTLTEKKFLQKNDNDTYYLGLKFVSIGGVVKTSASLYTIALPYVKQLRDSVGESVNLAVEMNGQTINLIHESGDSFLLMSALSPFSPFYCASIGKIFLAHMSEDECKAFFDQHLHKHTTHTITSYEQFLSEKESFFEDLIMYDNEEFEYGLSCIATPIFDCNEELISGISISGPTSRIYEKDLDKIKSYLKETALSITKELCTAKYQKYDLYKALG